MEYEHFRDAIETKPRRSKANKTQAGGQRERNLGFGIRGKRTSYSTLLYMDQHRQDGPRSIAEGDTRDRHHHDAISKSASESPN